MKIGFLQNHSSDSGLGLIEIMMAFGLIGFLAVTSTSLVGMMARQNKNLDVRMALGNLRNRLNSAIQNQQTWTSSLQVMQSSDPTFPNQTEVRPILLTTLQSPPDGWYPITVLIDSTRRSDYSTDYLHDDDVIFDRNPNNTDSDVRQRGFDMNGRKCIGFGIDSDGPGPGRGNDACPFQYTIEWRPLCPATHPCTAPGVQYRMILSYLPGASPNNGPLNAANWSLEPTNRNDPNYLASFCHTFRGTWSGSSCDFSGDSVCTNPSERLMGFEVQGTPPFETLQPRCEPMFSGADLTSCPDGEKIVQLNADGSKVCARNLAGASRPNCSVNERAVPADDKGGYTCVPLLRGIDTRPCPVGQKLVQFAEDGARACLPNLYGSQRLSCPTGQKVDLIYEDGTVQCAPNLYGARNLSCPEGQKVQRIDNDGTVHCTSTMASSAPRSCAAGEKLLGYDSDGSLICRPDQHRVKDCRPVRSVRIDLPYSYPLVTHHEHWACPDGAEPTDYTWYVDDAYINPQPHCQLAIMGLRISMQCIYSGNPDPFEVYVRCCRDL